MFSGMLGKEAFLGHCFSACPPLQARHVCEPAVSEKASTFIEIKTDSTTGTRLVRLTYRPYSRLKGMCFNFVPIRHQF